jgi:hypothetical protein
MIGVCSPSFVMPAMGAKLPHAHGSSEVSLGPCTDDGLRRLGLGLKRVEHVGGRRSQDEILALAHRAGAVGCGDLDFVERDGTGKCTKRARRHRYGSACGPALSKSDTASTSNRVPGACARLGNDRVVRI